MFLISYIAFFKKNDYGIYHYTPVRAAAKALITKRSFPVFAALTTHFDLSFVLSNKGREMTGAVILMGVMQGMGDVPGGRSKRGAGGGA